MTDTDKFKLKIIELKDKLPKNYHSLICEKYPELDNQKYYDRIRNVVNLKQVDEEVYRLLKEISIVGLRTPKDLPIDTKIEEQTPGNKEDKIDQLFKEI